MDLSTLFLGIAIGAVVIIALIILLRIIARTEAFNALLYLSFFAILPTIADSLNLKAWKERRVTRKKVAEIRKKISEDDMDEARKLFFSIRCKYDAPDEYRTLNSDEEVMKLIYAKEIEKSNTIVLNRLLTPTYPQDTKKRLDMLLDMIPRELKNGKTLTEEVRQELILMSEQVDNYRLEKIVNL